MMRVYDYLSYYSTIDTDRPCVRQGSRELSYGQVETLSNQLANGLLASGLAEGDRIGLLSKNSIEMLLIYLGCSKAGIVPVPVNWRLTRSEIAQILNDAGVKQVFCQSGFIELLDGDYSVIDIGERGDVQYPPFASWLHQQRAQLQPQVCETAPFYQMYTSGTTGTPKGVLISQRAIVANAMQTLPLFQHAFGNGKRSLIVMPMFHAGAASFCFGSIISGSTMVIEDSFDAEIFLHTLHAQGITVVNVVPAMLQAVLNVCDSDNKPLTFPALEVVIYGASAIAEDTLRRSLALFQCEFYQGYGQTESSAALTMLSADDHRLALQRRPQLLRSAGRPIVGTQLKIVDAQGRALPTGQCGELIAAGPQIMSGYWQLPEATAGTIVDGWLHTGDIGYLDEQGYLFLQDRLKDMIVSGGENIYPRELEDCLMNHADVIDAAVVGIPSDKYGESPAAFVVLSTGSSLCADQISAHCRQYLAGFKIPTLINIVAELPRNASGKVLKQVLRKPYWADRERHIS